MAIDEAGEVSMLFYDISGRMLYTRNEIVAAGVHGFEISKSDLKIDAGVVICRMMCDGEVIVRRLIVVGD